MIQQSDSILGHATEGEYVNRALGRKANPQIVGRAGVRFGRAPARRHSGLRYLAQLLLATFCWQAAGQTTSPWEHFTLAGGPSLDFSTYVYDSISNRMIVFGGSEQDGVTCVSDTWLITHANGIGGTPQWQKASPVGPLPPARSRASGVYDQKNNRMIIFGGGAGPCGGPFSVLFNDAWVLSNANGTGGVPTWTPLNPPAPLPAGRAEQGAVYDPNVNTMTIFGGCNDGIMDVPNDVWVLGKANGMDGQPNWTQLAPTGALPAPRCSPVVTYNSTIEPASSVMTVYSGCCPALSDLWVLNGANGVGTSAWQQLVQGTPAPGPRETGAFGYDGEINTLMFFGGYSWPGPQHYNDTWMLSDADDAGGVSTWFNTIPDNMAGSPTAGNDAFGGYDSTSKRLMAMQGEAPADLWVMTTRNGVDFSGANPSPKNLAAIARDGIQYAVGEISVRTSQNSASVAELQAFQNAAFKTAAYSFLGLDKNAAPGDQQVGAGVTALGGFGSATFNDVGFIAVDVEEESLLTAGKYNPAPLSTRLTIIAQALHYIASVGKKPVIYTNPTAWQKATGDAVCTETSGQTTCGPGAPGEVQAYPLWEFTSYNRFLNGAGKEYCGDGIPSLTPFTAFDGWSVTLGKQYDIGTQASKCAGTTLSGVQVDFDVFDPSLFQ